MLSKPPHAAALSPSPTLQNKTFFLVQGLRALAALIVIVFHGTLEMRRVVDHSFPLFDLGASGVDIFFVISGFVMTLSSVTLLTKQHGARTFLKRRLERIVPLYWIITTLQLIVTFFAPNLQEAHTGGAWRVLESFLFFPVNGFPIVAQGWTLNYEMLFYALFSISIALTIKPIRFVAPTLVALVCCYHFLSRRGSPLASLCDPVMLEFLFGMILASLVSRQNLIRTWKLWTSVVAAALIYAATFHVNLMARPYHRGVPAFLLVALAVVLEPKIGRRTPKLILELGNASYSIYLVHVLVMAFLFPFLIKGPFKGMMAEGIFIAI